MYNLIAISMYKILFIIPPFGLAGFKKEIYEKMLCNCYCVSCILDLYYKWMIKIMSYVRLNGRDEDRALSRNLWSKFLFGKSWYIREACF